MFAMMKDDNDCGGDDDKHYNDVFGERRRQQQQRRPLVLLVMLPTSFLSSSSSTLSSSRNATQHHPREEVYEDDESETTSVYFREEYEDTVDEEREQEREKCSVQKCKHTSLNIVPQFMNAYCNNNDYNKSTLSNVNDCTSSSRKINQRPELSQSEQHTYATLKTQIITQKDNHASTMNQPHQESKSLFFGLPYSLWITFLLVLHILVVGITIITMKMPVNSMSSCGDTTTTTTIGAENTTTNSNNDQDAATFLFHIISNSTKILYNDSFTTVANAESSLLEEFFHYLDVGDPESFSSISSATEAEASSLYFSSLPQYQSLQWLLHDDEYIHQKLQLLQMNDDDGDDMNVGSDDIDDKHLRRTVLERYVLGVVYYSSNANKATVVAASSRSSVTETIPASSSRRRSSMDKSWLLKSTNLSVCEWYGVECNDSTTRKQEGRNNDDDEVIIGLDLGMCIMLNVSS